MGENRYGLTVPESVSNEDLKKIAWDFARSKGNLVKLPKILGLSDERWKEFLEWLKDRSAPRQPDPRYPILIPETSPTSYISFKRALNLRLPDEWTGDWHFRVSFFGYPERSFAPLAGPNGLVDTTRSLGSRGVRDMGRLIDAYGIKPYDGPVWVANHYRAIADMAMDRICSGHWEAATFPAHQIAQWLWSEEDFDILVDDYLKPMREQIRGPRREAYDEWLPTVVYGADYD